MVVALEQINRVVWGLPTILLIVGTGLYLSFRTGFFQITQLPSALKLFFSKIKLKNQPNTGVSAYQALCTALAATVGTGNIAGVAGSIALGGPGSVFWMWLCAFLGMIVKCAEAALAVKYRHTDSKGNVYSGPMYIIEKGLDKRWKPLAMVYAFFGVVAAFGVGNATQINAVLDGIHSSAEFMELTISRKADMILASGFSLLLIVILLGGAQRIGKVAQALVPIASLGYILLGLGVLVVCRQQIPNAFYQIFSGAFSPEAVTAGAVGSMFISCRAGAARGVFTNEAGMGTAAIAHGSAQVKHPIEQGLMGIMEVFLDTIVICTVTALVILCSGVSIPYGKDIGAVLTFRAFSAVYGGWSNILITLCLCLFAFATMIGWGLYGLRCAQYLLGKDVLKIFVILQAATVVLGAALETGIIWSLAETVNGLMAIPNLVAIILISPEFFRLIRQYKTLHE